MADVKISGLPNATTPVAGTEVLPIVQGGQTRKVSIDNLTAGKSVTANSFIPTSSTIPTNGMFLGAANSVSIATNSTEHWMVNASGNLNPVGAKGIGTTLAPVNGTVSTQFTSTVATGTAPLVVSSTTEVANLRAANATSADTANQVKSNATTGVLQITGPGASTTRVMTTPDANFTAARTDAAQTFTGNQTFNNNIGIEAAPRAWSGMSAIDVGSGAGGALAANPTFGFAYFTSNAFYNGSSWVRKGADWATLYAAGDGNHYFYNAASSTAGSNINFNETVVFDDSNNIKITNGNLVIGTSGKGIDFSVTSEGTGTMTSELFSDYEEGTWTATLTGSTAAPTTPVTATGRYTKIGRLVNVMVSFVNADTTGATGVMRITGLPYTASANVTYAMGTAGSFNTGAAPMIARISASQTLMDFVQIVDVSSVIAINAGTPRFLFVNVTYQA